jgi:hypothetical protein
VSASLGSARALEPTLSEAAGPLDQVVGHLRTLDLPGLETGASLLTRVDRKYLIPVATVERLVESLGDEWLCLEIEGRRSFGYSSTYFDTLDLHTYRAHVQRRRLRFKVRVRRYTDSGLSVLEVKRKDLRGVTVKARTPHASWHDLTLGPEARTFVADALRDYAELPTGQLQAVVTTTNRRTTLASLGGHARCTIDADLTCGWGERTMALRPGFVLVETKSEGPRAAAADRMLRALGERPVNISKYCVGVASLGLDVPTNPWRRILRRYFENTAS